jgi:hypothetical protein
MRFFFCLIHSKRIQYSSDKCLEECISNPKEFLYTKLSGKKPGDRQMDSQSAYTDTNRWSLSFI